MKKLNLQCALIVAASLLSACASDTPSAPPMTASEAAESNSARSALRTDKVLIINKNMNLSPSNPNYDEFWHQYYPYEAKLKKLSDERIKLIRDYTYNLNQIDDKAADSFAERFFDIKTRRLELLRDYYEKMKRATSPAIAARFVQIENEISNIIDAELNAQIPLVETTK